MLSLGVTNAFTEGRDIYLFHRKTDGTPAIFHEATFRPYYFEPKFDGLFKGYMNKRLEKIFCNNPYQIKQERTPDSYESDLLYHKRYLYDNIIITKAKLRWVMFDIEILCEDFPDPFKAERPISLITTYDNYTKEYKQFVITKYKTEYDMIGDFISYIRTIQPDLLVAYNGIQFDFCYLINRFPDFAESISPINKKILKNNFPAGISIIDYMAFIKKVCKYKRYSLEYVYCDTFKLPYKREKFDFSSVNEDLVTKNKFDVQKMVELEDKLHLIPYFDELRIEAKGDWDDVTQNSRLIDGVLLQIAKEKGIILPKRPDYVEKIEGIEETDSIKGAYVYAETGLHENCHLFDAAALYPNLIMTFCLDSENKRKIKEGNTIEINKVCFAQNKDVLAPILCKKLMVKRNQIKEQIKITPDDELLKQKDAAYKSLVNSVYGIMLFSSSRLFDMDVASSITYLARFLIRYTKFRLRQFGYHVVLSDTDSVYVQTTESPEIVSDIINNQIVKEWLNYFGKTEGSINFKHEDSFKTLFVLTKKHYRGIKIDGSKKDKGLELLRSDTSKYTEGFQDILLEKVMNRESKEDVVIWVKSEIERMKTLSIEEIGLPCKLQRPINEYKNLPIFVRALQNTQFLTHFERHIGEYFYYIYVISQQTRKITKTRKIKGVETTKEEDVPLDVMAFDEGKKEHIVNIDYDKMLDRNIFMKCEGIFEAMKWEMNLIKPDKIKIIKEKKPKKEKVVKEKKVKKIKLTTKFPTEDYQELIHPDEFEKDQEKADNNGEL